MKTDAELTADVYSALGTDPAVSITDLGVIANHGHVTLDGTTATQASKEAAQRAASGVPGVERVTNAIAVDPEALGTRTDEQIRTDVHRALVLDNLVPLDTIGVAVENGIVTLTGDVDDRYLSELAEDDVGQVPGVRGVVNRISVKS
jgi:osmotically-inducible protein OsmY